MFGRRRPAKPDSVLLARVSDATEVVLGTYPEDALAVVGAYPARHSLDHRPDSASSFRRLDGQARQAAMQAALDRLVAERTLNVPASRSLKDVVADGLNGKLEVSGPLADQYLLADWFHRSGFRAGLIVDLMTSEGLRGVRMPDGVAAAGLETCFGLSPSGGGNVSVLLVERPDNQAGTRSYTLRTVRAEFTRMAAYLFADVTRNGEALLASARMSFRFGPATLQVETDFFRQHGDDAARGRITTHSRRAGRRRQLREPAYIKVPFSDVPDVLTKYFVSAAARTQ